MVFVVSRPFLRKHSQKQCTAVIRRAADSAWMLTEVESASSSRTSLCVTERSEDSHDQRMESLHLQTHIYTTLLHTHLCSQRRSGWHVCDGCVRALFRNRLILLYVFGWGVLQLFSNSSRDVQRIFLTIRARHVGISLLNHFINATIV